MADPFQLSASVDAGFSDTTPGDGVAACGLGDIASSFLGGLVKGALVTAVIIGGIALLPEEAAIAATIGLATLGTIGAARLALAWKGMTVMQKAEAAGEVTGGLLTGGAVGFARAAAGRGATVLPTEELLGGAEETGGGGLGEGPPAGDIPTQPPKDLPEGLAYRTDLPKHLAGPDGFTKSGQLSGTHNLASATDALDDMGATYTQTPTGTPGISDLQYSYTNAAGKLVSGSKTVYDPAVVSDSSMLESAMAAGQDGFEQHLLDPSERIFDTSQDGINFRTYINFDKFDNPYVGNVHPIN